MKPPDRNLGMDRPISRRDPLLGMGASAASAFIPGRAFADEMLRLLTTSKDAIPDHSSSEEEDYLYSISYREFLSRDLNIREPEIYAIFENLMSDWCVGIEAVPAIEALYWGLPGINATSLGGDSGRLSHWFEPGSQEPSTYHFPDGNASVARMLVRNMIPDVAPGTTIEDVVLAPFDFSKLDRAGSSSLINIAIDQAHRAVNELA